MIRKTGVRDDERVFLYISDMIQRTKPTRSLIGVDCSENREETKSLKSFTKEGQLISFVMDRQNHRLSVRG